MKKLLPLLFLCIGFVIHAQEVEPVQNSLITKISATWCFNCGTWGWDAHEKIIEENVENTLHFNAHYSGDLQSDVALAFSSNFNSFGQPQFFLNNENRRLNFSNATDKVAELKTAVASNATQLPVAGVASVHEFVDGYLTVQSNVKFFQSVTGEYFLATYILEEGIMNYQEGQFQVVPHKKVMRQSMSDNHFGDPINIAEETSVALIFTELSPEWNQDNLEMVSIIWKKEGDKYVFVNGARSSLKMETVDPGPEMPTDPTPDPDPNPTPPTMGEAPDFPEFPWMNELIDPNNCCDNTSIKVYNSGIYQFVYIEGEASCSENMGTLYFQNGTLYCSDSPGVDCRSAYGLTDLAKSWDCSGGMTNAGPMEEEPNNEDNAPSFEEFPWLNDLITADNCCNNRSVTAYYSGIYTFIYIETDPSCGDSASQLYFENGTFYCSDANGMDCRGAYGLSADRSSLLWECSN